MVAKCNPPGLLSLLEPSKATVRSASASHSAARRSLTTNGFALIPVHVLDHLLTSQTQTYFRTRKAPARAHRASQVAPERRIACERDARLRCLEK